MAHGMPYGPQSFHILTGGIQAPPVQVVKKVLFLLLDGRDAEGA
jgi:hypothetical protein